jgi:hypothetical protein
MQFTKLWFLAKILIIDLQKKIKSNPEIKKEFENLSSYTKKFIIYLRWKMTFDNSSIKIKII